MKIKKYIALALAVLTLTMMFAPAALATSLSRFKRYTSGSSKTLWNYDSAKNHKGNTDIYVKYTNINNNAVLKGFINTYIPRALDSWNSVLDSNASIFVGTSSTCNFIVKGETNIVTGNVIDCTTDPTTDSSGHMTGYTLTLYESTIGALNAVAREKAAQQAIGYMFGLRRVSDSGVIMSETFHNTNLSNPDKCGMYVMTHKHKHNVSNVTLPNGTTSTSKYNYQYKSSSEHTVKCTYCNTYFYYDHTCTTYQHNSEYHRVSCGKCTTYIKHTMVNNVCKYCRYAGNIV